MIMTARTCPWLAVFLQSKWSPFMISGEGGSGKVDSAVGVDKPTRRCGRRCRARLIRNDPGEHAGIYLLRLPGRQVTSTVFRR